MAISDLYTALGVALDKANSADAFEYCRLLLGELKALNRVVNPQEINLVGVADEAIRRVVDPPYTTLAASLDAAYYQHWARGESHDWHGYDVQPTPDESKAQFDRLSGLIWHEYAIALDEADLLRDPEDRIPDSRKIGDEDGRTLRQIAEDWKQREGLSLPEPAKPAPVTREQLPPRGGRVR